MAGKKEKQEDPQPGTSPLSSLLIFVFSDLRLVLYRTDKSRFSLSDEDEFSLPRIITGVLVAFIQEFARPYWKIIATNNPSYFPVPDTWKFWLLLSMIYTVVAIAMRQVLRAVWR
jgi:hypothetical protein